MFASKSKSTELGKDEAVDETVTDAGSNPRCYYAFQYVFSIFFLPYEGGAFGLHTILELVDVINLVLVVRQLEGNEKLHEWKWLSWHANVQYFAFSFLAFQMVVWIIR